jgi:hypothetical protein
LDKQKQQSSPSVSDVPAYERLNFDRVSEPEARRLQDENSAYYSALDALDFAAVEADLVTLMHTSQEQWCVHECAIFATQNAH